MKFVPGSADRYVKFLRFIVRHWNSDLFEHASDQIVTGEAEDQSSSIDYEKPKELADDLRKMGPTYVKLGQLLSTRPDLLPDHYLEALAELQDDVDSIDFDLVREIFEEDTGIRISKAFENFEEDPMASASIGQVHRAVLKNGKKVAVKIRRPGVKKSFLEDLDTLEEITELAVKHIGAARRYALDEVLEEFRFMLLNELDYTREANNLIALGENLRSYDKLIVPQPITDFSSTRVLTMDFIDGTKVTALGSLKRLESDLTPLTEQLVKAYLQQIVFDGFAHADPHPGNIHLTNDEKLALIDLGMVARFSSSLQESFLKLMISISQYDGEEVADVMLEMSEKSEDANLPEFRKKITRLVLDNQNKKVRDMETGRLIIQMNRIAAESGIKIAVELNILGKILLNMDKIVASLSPNFDFQKTIYNNVEKMMMQKAKEELKPRNFFSKAIESKRLLEALPSRINKITSDLAKGEFTLNVNTIDEKRLTADFQKVANRITLGLIIAAMIIGAALLMNVPTTFKIFGYPGLPLLFFVLAALAGLYLVINIMRKDEDLGNRK
ncbi:MAG: AarF/ABC1/UbiB kinase family protein [Saprospirales bacterium]|nr:MAG: AarF/ABC1/UbiB kinase family protein [Saprospirales bacterium]